MSIVSKYICIGISILCSVFLFLPSALYAEQYSGRLATQEQQLKLEEAEGLRRTEKMGALEKDKPYSFDFGGWISSYVRFYSNLDNSKEEGDYISRIWTQDVRAWGKMTYEKFFFSYIRFRTQHEARRVAQGYGEKQNDFQQPTFDMGYIRILLKNIILDTLEMTVGRQTFRIGRGISYYDIHDGVLVKLENEHLALQSFYSKTRPHENNIDYSVPGYGKTTDRRFLGIETVYKMIPKHAFYWYALAQMDHSGEDPYDYTQDYAYNSQYYGAGLSGRPYEMIRYWVEYMKEQGKDYNDVQSPQPGKARIDAAAFMCGIKYFFPFTTHPGLEMEYVYGSGDEDRQRVTTTQRGNKQGRDNAFIYFGEYYGGYALTPRITNLSLYKVDFSLTPFEHIPFVDTVWCGVKYFLYRKNEANGAIYDIEATQGHRDVGYEWDAYVHWQIYTNFFYSFRYGIFYPGKAYDANHRDATKYFFGRVTLTF